MKTTALMRLGALVCAVSVAGCAMTQIQFERDRAKITDFEACRQAKLAWTEGGSEAMKRLTMEEIGRRNISVSACKELIAREEVTAAGALGALLLVGVVAAGARSGGLSNALNTPSQVEDRSWAWDLQHNDLMQAQWVCRGMQTGQYADLSRCMMLPKHDMTWPGLGR